MAISTNHLTLLASQSSSTASSSSMTIPTWFLSPVVFSSVVILACLITTIVTAASVEEMVLGTDVPKSVTRGRNLSRINSIFYTKTNKIGSKAKHKKDMITKIVTTNFIINDKMEENFNSFTGILEKTIPHAKVSMKNKRRHTRQKPNLVMKKEISNTKREQTSGIKPNLNMLDDTTSMELFSNFVHLDSSIAGIADLNSEDLKNFNLSFYQARNSGLVREERLQRVKKSWTQTEDVTSIENILDLNARLKFNAKIGVIQDTAGYIDKLTNDNLESNSHRQPSLSSKRHHRSVDDSTNDYSRSSPQVEMIFEAVKQVHTFQSNRSLCLFQKNLEILKPVNISSGKLFSLFEEEVNKTVQMANILSDLLLYTKSPPEDFMDVFLAMTQSVVETEPQVIGCAIVFNLLNSGPSPVSPTSATSSSPSSYQSSSTKKKRSLRRSLYPYSYRNREEAVVVTDLSMIYDPQTTTWFTVHINKSTAGLLKPKYTIYANKTDMGNISHPNAMWNRTVSVLPEDGYWATPYFDCLLKNWVVQYSVPFYQLEGTTPEFKGVVVLEANFELIKINQCANDGSLFANTHRCRRQTTKCKNIPSHTLAIGSYECICKDGYMLPGPNSSSNSFNGRNVEAAYMDYISNLSSNYTTDFDCLVMRGYTLSTMQHSMDPVLGFDFLARRIPLGIQSICMTLCVVLGAIILCLRKTKVMRTSIWLLLEMFLLGAILLYATVVVQFFEPTTITCLLLPWFREVGFVIVYGVLVLKIYRILAEFQSRKAHRVHVRDKDLFKYLAVILVVVVAYMSAWTAVNMDHLDNNSTILERLYTEDDGLSYTLCRSMWWDFVIETGEFIFLCFGIYMCYCVRSAQTDYSEGRYITAAICYEAVMSSIFYVLRHLWWSKMRPDYLFLMFFMRCQLTVTVVILVILGPKLWYAHWPPDEDQARSRAYSQSDVQDSSAPETMKLNVGISSNGDVEVGEISLTEMDPEDIRAELKRLYTQLQIYKTKTMRKDNPHISKRRGGRKQTHRRFSLQAFHHKHRHHHDHDHDHDISKTPEESTNSAEAMTFTIEPSVKEDPNEGRSYPSVSFKPGHK